ncbi:MAG: hypothetical protein ACJ75B_07865 [Flavisolibacter sp.]
MNRHSYTYEELLSVVVDTEFYQNKTGSVLGAATSNDLVILPSEETMNLIKRKDYLLRANPARAGFSVFTRVEGKNGLGNSILRFPVSKEDKLVFFLLPGNPLLYNFSDLPANLSFDYAYYLQNDIDDVGATRNNLHLSLDPWGIMQQDSIKKTFSNYIYHHPAPVLANTARVKHLLSARTVNPVSIFIQSGETDLAFDLSGFPLGACQLLINNVLTEQFYYCGTDVLSSLFAILELKLDASLKQNYRIVQADRSITPAKPLFVVRLMNRPTRWRYTIQLDPGSPLYQEITALPEPQKTNFINDINIVTNSTVSFTPILGTENKLVFLSDAPVLLQEKYFNASGKTLQLTLKKNISGTPKEVKDYLPYPSTGMIDTSQLPTIYSDIFLTI